MTKPSAQLLPTPQNSTTSSGKEDYLSALTSSELDEENFNRHGSAKKRKLSHSFVLKRPRLLRSSSNSRASITKTLSSSWPFRSNPSDKFFNFFAGDQNANCSKYSKNYFNLQLKRLLQRDFPYDRVIGNLSQAARRMLFTKDLWTFLLKVATIYTGEDVKGDLQKRNEVAFAAWTTLLRFYALMRRVRGGEGQVEKMAIASIVIQAKLLEEADVDLVKLERKLTKLGRFKVSKSEIEVNEGKICNLLGWKLLVPSPQVILFTLLDNVGVHVSLPASLKLLVSKVLDGLIEDFFLQEYYESVDNCGKLAGIVATVAEIVLGDFFSVFQVAGRVDVGKVFKENLAVGGVEVTVELRTRIEKAIETVMSENV